MKQSEWFLKQLQTGAEQFEWNFWSVPEHLRTQLPIDPPYMGTWPAVRHVWHVTEYERCLAIPGMRQWLGAPTPANDWLDDDETWHIHQDTPPQDLITRFWEMRREELALVQELQRVDWNEHRDTVWGYKPLSWVVTKTYQHTFEHGDTLLRMSLWWEHIAEQIALARTEEKP
ncbi:hypothetical protein GC175_31345 [bacterium]|nr:hypothetical protein [bacterium]